MKTKTKTVYYCDYCKKHSLSGGTLAKHEKHCTANPDRICRMCGRENIKAIIPKYKIEIKEEWFTEHNSVLGEVGVEIDKMVAKKMEELADEVDNCPACILTVIRLNKYIWPIKPDFNYPKAVEEWWEARREDEESLMYG